MANYVWKLSDAKTRCVPSGGRPNSEGGGDFSSRKSRVYSMQA